MVSFMRQGIFVRSSTPAESGIFSDRPPIGVYNPPADLQHPQTTDPQSVPVWPALPVILLRPQS
jgi:hypothetical protein